MVADINTTLFIVRISATGCAVAASLLLEIPKKRRVPSQEQEDVLDMGPVGAACARPVYQTVHANSLPKKAVTHSLCSTW